MKEFITFEDKVCLVTGAGSEGGIGYHTAKILRELGGEVIIVSTTDRIYDRAEEIGAEGIICDLMDRNKVEALISGIKEKYGRIDVLINNAGMVQTGVSEEEFTPFSELSYESWDNDISRNLAIPFNVTRCVLPIMMKNEYGRIVNTSSVTGPVVSNPGEAAYSAAKAAICGMSRSIAIEAGEKNITINNVLPGWIETLSQTESEYQGGFNTPMRRSGKPEEIANLIVFLASDKASYITGQDFVIDGGNTIQEYKGDSRYYY